MSNHHNNENQNTGVHPNGQKYYTHGSPIVPIAVQGNEGNTVPMNPSMYYPPIPPTYYQTPAPYYSIENHRNSYQAQPLYQNNETYNFVPPQKSPPAPQILENNIITPESLSKRKSDITIGSSKVKKIEVNNENDKSSKTIPRKRALTACDNCRYRKVKCDNERPRCGACVKNGIDYCHYKVDDQVRVAAFDSSTEKIISKLDLILNRLDKNPEIKSPITKKNDENTDLSVKSYSEVLEDCTWDFSVTSLLRWNYLMVKTNTTYSEYTEMVRAIVSSLDSTSLPPTVNTLNEKFSNVSSIEGFLNKNFSNLISSFLTHSHSKAPILDSLRLMESIDMYKILSGYKKDLSFIFLLENFDEKNDPPQYYFDALKEKDMDDNPFLKDSYKYLCSIIPVVILMCAIGVIATPLKLDNFTNYKNSMEERSDLKIGCIAEENIPDHFPKDRLKLSQMLLDYANLLTTCFPFSLIDNSLITVQYYLLLNQYHLYIMNPLISHKNIIKANHHLMFYLQRRKISSTEYEICDSDKDVIDRLFWTSLKFECELKSELSPYVPTSGITKVLPTISFPSLPEFATSPIERTGNHREEIIQLANVYNDEYSWYFFLTEVAYRKVDNAMNNELYSTKGPFYEKWDDPEFFESFILGLFVKYLNQYNGILYSLHPNLRSFILNQSNVEEINRVLKQRFLEKKKKYINKATHIPDHLNEFFSDDIKIKNQSDSIVFMQSRVIVSKLMLFRPLIYLIITGKITVKEVLIASFQQNRSTNINPSELEGDKTQLVTPIESDTELTLKDLIPDEDFSDLITETENTDEQSESFKLSNIPEVKKRILRTFMGNLISLPKLHVPNIAGYRHPGSWYYIRNVFVSNIYLYVLYTKLIDSTTELENDEELRQFLLQNHVDSIEIIINAILSKDSLIASMQHSLRIYEYWMDESKDCKIYHDFTKKLLNNI